MPPKYTDDAAFEEFTDLTPVVGSVEELLMQAERDVDMALGRIPQDPTTGLKLLPSTLQTWQVEALSRAVCAQAVYRIIKGDTFFREMQPLDPSGPDGSQKGRESYLAPEADRELTYGKLYNLVGRSQVPFPNQNWQDWPDGP